VKIRFAIASGLATVAAAAVNPALACPDLDVGSNSATAQSWVAGGQAGYNWQQGAWVYGVEADIAATHLDSSMQGALTQLGGNCFGPAVGATSGTVDWYGTARGRVGVTSGPLLFYGTGGLAYGKVDLQSTVDFFGSSLQSQTSSIRTGWVAGGGIEYAVRPNTLLTLGYQYIDLGTASVAGAVDISGEIVSLSASAHAHFQVVALGLNWSFGPATGGAREAMASAMPLKALRRETPSSPWQGFYLGGHAGGAWGNSTDAAYSVLP
jgi:outer membrane immunogenic protein